MTTPEGRDVWRVVLAFVEAERQQGYQRSGVAVCNALLNVVGAHLEAPHDGLPECICPKCGVRHGGSSFDPEHPF